LKIYEKPKLMVLSISANDMLCSGCTVKRIDDPIYIDRFDSDGNGILTAQEAENQGLFGDGTDDACTVPVTGYCKHNGTANQVFIS
jgi:hypothetical protein